MTNQVHRPVEISGKVELVPLSSIYTDSNFTVTTFDLGRYNKNHTCLLQIYSIDSIEGVLAIEESDGDGVWTRTWSTKLPGIGGYTELFEFKRSKRYLRVPDPGLDAETLNCMALTLFY